MNHKSEAFFNLEKSNFLNSFIFSYIGILISQEDHNEPEISG